MIVSRLISFEYVAFVILLLLFVVYTGKKKTKLPIYKVYYWILIVTLLTSFFNIVLNISSKNVEYFSLGFFNVVAALYYGTFFAIGLVCNQYILGLAGVNYRKSVLWRGLLFFPYAAFLSIAITSPVTEFLFYYDENKIYHVGSMFWITYVCVFYYVGIWIFLLFRFIKQLSKQQLAYLSSFVTILSTFSFIQYLYANEIVMTFPISLCLIVVVLGIQKTSEIFDETNAMRFSYLIEDVKNDLEYGYDFNIYFIKIHDVDSLYESFGDAMINELFMKVSFFLDQLVKGSYLFRLDKGTYVLKSDNPEKEDMEKVAQQIGQRFKLSWGISGISVDLPVSIIYAGYPKDIADKKTFYNLIELVQNMDFEVGDVKSFKEVDFDNSDEKIEEAIRKAIANNKLYVYYQPIYSDKEKGISAAEALVRLYDDEMGMLSPDKFIPVAEKSELIFQIGRFVFKEVCRFYAENKLDEKGIKYVEVNLSGLQMMQYQMAEEFCEIMNGWKISHEKINFEITETSALIKNMAVTQNIKCFVDKGIELSLDDFGTGYSNLSYLYNIPFSIIKIDKGILWDADKNEKADVVLANTVGMSKKMKMRIVVEGVENEEHVKKMLSHGCEYLQGFYFSKPIPGKEFLEYIDNFQLPEICVSK